MPEYTYRQTVFYLRRGRSCAINNRELLKQVAAYEGELDRMKNNVVVTTEVVNTKSVEIQTQIADMNRQKLIYDAAAIRMKNGYEDKLKNIGDHVVVLDKVIEKKKRAGLHGFMYGVIVGVVVTVGTAFTIAK